MTVNYKVRDIKGTIYDVEIEKNKTIKDFKEAIADVIQDDNYRCDLLNIIFNNNVIKDDDKTIESIGAEEGACFAISQIPTVSIKFILPPKQDLSNYQNLQQTVDHFLIDKECTEPKRIIEAICYQEPSLNPENVYIFSNNWAPFEGPIEVGEGKRFGLYIQEDGYTPLIFKGSTNSALLAFPSNDTLQAHETEISNEFSHVQLEFYLDNSKIDTSKPINTLRKFSVIKLTEKHCALCLLI